MHGIGNDFIFVDALKKPLPESEIERLSQAMNDRRFGIGGDGLILIEKGSHAPFRMRMFNPDGSYSDMCGNGVRCMGRFLLDKGHADRGPIKIESGDRVIELTVQADGLLRVDMGKALLTRREIGMEPAGEDRFIGETIETSLGMLRGCTAVSMGNPHVVCVVENVDRYPLEQWGPVIENHELFPNRTNVHFVQVLDSRRLIQRTWERGAGITLACGTGACACGVASFLMGLSEREVEIQLPGGNLIVEYDENGTVYLTGPVETAFEGTWPD